MNKVHPSSCQFANPAGLRLVELHFRSAIPIVFNHRRAIPDLRHPGPHIFHGGENLRLAGCGKSKRRSDRSQLRHGLAAALDHDDATLFSFAHQLRCMNMKFPHGRTSHVPHCSNSSLAGGGSFIDFVPPKNNRGARNILFRAPRMVAPVSLPYDVVGSCLTSQPPPPVARSS